MAKRKTGRRTRGKGVEYNGLGFPVMLIGFEFEEIFGKKLPKLNHRKLEDSVFTAILGTRVRLTGAHLAFVRKYMGMTQAQFATELGMQGHSRISQWEAKKQDPTGMSSVTEMGIRVLIADYLGRRIPKGKELREIMRGNLDDPSLPIEIEAA